MATDTELAGASTPDYIGWHAVAAAEAAVAAAAADTRFMATNRDEDNDARRAALARLCEIAGADDTLLDSAWGRLDAACWDRVNDMGMALLNHVRDLARENTA